MRASTSLSAIALILGILLPTASGFASDGQRTLRVVLYPYIPDKEAYFTDVKRTFEKLNPDIELELIDLSDNYYDESSPHAITNTDADVMEVDSVFLQDLVDAHDIQPLRTDLGVTTSSFVPVATSAVMIRGVQFGVPHWLCTSFLITSQTDPLSKATTFSDIVKGLGGKRAPNTGLLIDLEGKSTLGELYLNAVIARNQPANLTSILPTTIDQGIVTDIRKIRLLCDPEYCRDKVSHDIDGFYPRMYAHKRGRAYVGYSESLYYVGLENMTNCGSGECVGLDQISINPLPLADTKPRPFAWVDSFTISSGCLGQCLADAETFVRFITSKNQVRNALLPTSNGASRYLLPALSSLYTDRLLLAQAPLYLKLYPIIKNAVPVDARNLNCNLRVIGKQLDNALDGRAFLTNVDPCQ